MGMVSKLAFYSYFLMKDRLIYLVNDDWKMRAKEHIGQEIDINLVSKRVYFFILFIE